MTKGQSIDPRSAHLAHFLKVWFWSRNAKMETKALEFTDSSLHGDLQKVVSGAETFWDCKVQVQLICFEHGSNTFVIHAWAPLYTFN